MSLLAWQTALAEQVTARAAGIPVPPTSPVSAEDSLWLDSVSASAGFKLTCDVQRWWREFRVQQAAPLTLGALTADLRIRLMDEYVRRHCRPSSFFLREALPFLDLAAELGGDLPHVAALAAFERAMLRLGSALADDPTLGQVRECQMEIPVEAHPLAEVVRFQAPPGAVLAAAAGALPFPPPEDRAYWLLIAAGLSNLAAGCTTDEARLFQTIRAVGVYPPRAVAPAFRRLWEAGALQHTV
jgi:hypothetical protein